MRGVERGRDLADDAADAPGQRALVRDRRRGRRRRPSASRCRAPRPPRRPRRRAGCWGGRSPPRSATRARSDAGRRRRRPARGRSPSPRPARPRCRRPVDDAHATAADDRLDPAAGELSPCREFRHGRFIPEPTTAGPPNWFAKLISDGNHLARHRSLGALGAVATCDRAHGAAIEAGGGDRPLPLADLGAGDDRAPRAGGDAERELAQVEHVKRPTATRIVASNSASLLIITPPSVNMRQRIEPKPAADGANQKRAPITNSGRIPVAELAKEGT